MGMSVVRARGVASEPNVVPLIDVLLVLIIIFMVITPKIPTGLPALVPLPAPPTTPQTPDPSTIVVRVMRDGKLMINQDSSDWDALGARLAEIFKQRADRVAFVKGADDVPFDQVARAIDIMRGAGIEHVALIAANSDN